MEEGVGVGDAVPLVVHHPVGTAAVLDVRLGPVINERRLVAGQSQLVHLGVGGVTDADGQRRAGREGEKADRVELAHLWNPNMTKRAIGGNFNPLAVLSFFAISSITGKSLTWNRGHT